MDLLIMAVSSLWLFLSGGVHILAGIVCAFTAWLLTVANLEMIEENLPIGLNLGINKEKILTEQRKWVGICSNILIAMAVVQLLLGLAQIAMALIGNSLTLKTVCWRVAGCLALGLLIGFEVTTIILVCQLDGSLVIWKHTLINIESQMKILAIGLALVLNTTIIIQIFLLKFGMNDPAKEGGELSFLPNMRMTPMMKSTPNVIPGDFTFYKANRPRILSCFVDSTDYEKHERKSRAKFPLTNELRCTIKTIRGMKGAEEQKAPQVVIHKPSEINGSVSQTSQIKTTEKHQNNENMAQLVLPLISNGFNRPRQQTQLEDDVFGDTEFKKNDSTTNYDKSGPSGRNSVHVSMTIDFENRFNFPSLGKFDEAFLLFLNSSDEPQLSPSAFSVDISLFSVL